VGVGVGGATGSDSRNFSVALRIERETTTLSV
jgi:hypothetical protein